MRKKIQSYPNYYADEYGDIYNKSGKKLYTWVDNTGYMQVVLHQNNKRVYKRAHRLVYEAFHGPITKGFVINHIDENKANNKIENLEAATVCENVRSYYENNEVTKYDVSVYDLNNNFIKRYYSLRSLCSELKLNRSSMANILKGIRNNKYPYKFIENKVV